MNPEATAQITQSAQQLANAIGRSFKVWKFGDRYETTEWEADLSADGGIVVYQARPVEAAGDLLGLRRFS